MTTEASIESFDLDLRDYFAAAVMTEMLRQAFLDATVHDIAEVRQAASDAYVVADAMIKARGEKT